MRILKATAVGVFFIGATFYLCNLALNALSAPAAYHAPREYVAQQCAHASGALEQQCLSYLRSAK